MKKKSYGKLLISSALSVVLCAFMLAGATWAWFTDSVTSAGNRIQAGTLKISASSASINPAATEKPFAIADFNDGEAFGFGASQSLETAGPIIGETNWEPGKGNAKLLSVQNAGTLAAKIKLRFSVTDGGLADALWFDFVQVSADNAVTGTFTRRPMSTLSAFAEALELPLARENDEVRFLFLYGMNEGAGNEYQDTSFEVSVTILAKQMSAEADGFGDIAYDKEATYDVASETELQAAISSAQSGDSIRLSSGSFDAAAFAAIPEGVSVTGAVNADGKPATSVRMAAGGTLEVAASNVSVSNLNFTGGGKILTPSTVSAFTLENCGFTDTTVNPHSVGFVMKDCTFSGSGRAVEWGYANGDVLIENCVFEMTGYGYPIHFDGGASSITIRGCTMTGYLIAIGSTIPEVIFENNVVDCYVNVYTTWKTSGNTFNGKTDFDFKTAGLVFTSVGDTWNVTSFSGNKATATITIDGVVQTFA